MKRIISGSIIGATLALATLGGIVQAAPAAQPVAQLITQRGGGGKHNQNGSRQVLSASLIKATASETGLSGTEVVTQLKAGKSLAQIAQGKGKSADTIIANVRTKLKQQLDKAVTNKKLTQAQADAKLAEFDKNAATTMQDTALGQTIQQHQEQRQKMATAGLLIKATADVTGLSAKDVRTELKAGKSLAQIAQSKGKTSADVLAKAKELLQSRQQNLLNGADTLINQTGLTDSTTK